MHNHTSMDIEQPQITSDKDLTPEQCKQASEGRSLTPFDHKLTFERGKKETHHKWIDVNGDYINECKGYEWITKDTFESHIQDITLEVRIKDGKYSIEMINYYFVTWTNLDVKVHHWTLMPIRGKPLKIVYYQFYKKTMHTC